MSSSKSGSSSSSPRSSHESFASDKFLAKRAQAVLAGLGHKVSLGHAYELLARLSGFASWNVATASSTPLAVALRANLQAAKVVGVGVSVDVEGADERTHGGGRRQFDVKVKGLAEVRKFYRVTAGDEAEAKAVVEEYVRLQVGDLTESEVKLAATLALAKIEGYYGLTSDNWEVSGDVEDHDLSVEDVYSPLPDATLGAGRDGSRTRSVAGVSVELPRSIRLFDRDAGSIFQFDDPQAAERFCENLGLDLKKVQMPGKSVTEVPETETDSRD